MIDPEVGVDVGKAPQFKVQRAFDRKVAVLLPAIADRHFAPRFVDVLLPGLVQQDGVVSAGAEFFHIGVEGWRA
ncbi:hypothetical protein D3C76_1439420 [compost metagenome]